MCIWKTFPIDRLEMFLYFISLKFEYYFQKNPRENVHEVLGRFYVFKWNY